MSDLGIKQFLYCSFFRQYDIDNDLKGPVFIIGTGRSGTHYLCSCLNKFNTFNDFFEGRESHWMFSHVARLTVEEKSLPSAVFGYYAYMQKKVEPEIFVDQTHPNIWHVEQLLKKFPNSKFIAISRNLYSVVYSMSMHQGVSTWIKQHKKYPKPNRFLGISLENIKIYEESLTDLQRSVFRWCSHMERIEELLGKFPASVMHLGYEDLHINMQDSMNKVAEFVGVEPPENLAKFEKASLYKKNLLSSCEIKEINEALNIYGFDKGRLSG